MDTNKFVLSFAAFMVVVTLMFAVSQWDFSAPRKALPAYACTIEGLCRGSDCSAPLPPEMVILPEAEDGKAYLYSPADTFFPVMLETGERGEWAMRSGTLGKALFTLRETGALTVTEYAGFEAGSPVLSVASGTCRDVTYTPREQG